MPKRRNRSYHYSSRNEQYKGNEHLHLLNAARKHSQQQTGITHKTNAKRDKNKQNIGVRHSSMATALANIVNPALGLGTKCKSSSNGNCYFFLLGLLFLSLIPTAIASEQTPPATTEPKHKAHLNYRELSNLDASEQLIIFDDAVAINFYRKGNNSIGVDISFGKGRYDFDLDPKNLSETGLSRPCSWPYSIQKSGLELTLQFGSPFVLDSCDLLTAMTLQNKSRSLFMVNHLRKFIIKPEKHNVVKSVEPQKDNVVKSVGPQFCKRAGNENKSVNDGARNENKTGNYLNFHNITLYLHTAPSIILLAILIKNLYKKVATMNLLQKMKATLKPVTQAHPSLVKLNNAFIMLSHLLVLISAGHISYGVLSAINSAIYNTVCSIPPSKYQDDCHNINCGVTIAMVSALIIYGGNKMTRSLNESLILQPKEEPQQGRIPEGITVSVVCRARP